LAIEVGLKLFFYLLIGDGGGIPLKGRYLHITVAVVGAPLKGGTTYTLKLLFGFPLKA